MRLAVTFLALAICVGSFVQQLVFGDGTGPIYFILVAIFILQLATALDQIEREV